MTQAAISIQNLTKIYAGSGSSPDKLALDDVSIDIPRGEIFGLLGPNGAGKSTLINTLSGMIRKTSGSANIWGFDIDNDPRNAKASIGIVPQEYLVGKAMVSIFSTDGSANWLLPWTWFSAARWDRIGETF